jgi:asparagine synthase (glutamine-hydrolysing)
LKRAARRLVPSEILDRKKQPYRAPDALAFAGGEAPPYADEAMSEAAVARAGIFEPAAVAKQWPKCRASATGPVSNADTMAIVGVLSTQLLHAELVEKAPAPRAVELTTLVDRA